MHRNKKVTAEHILNVCKIEHMVHFDLLTMILHACFSIAQK